MILNRLVVPEGNNIRFGIEHKEDGGEYTLKKGESYYIKIIEPSEKGNIFHLAKSDTNYFDFANNFKFGSYVFEVGISAPAGKERIILPALDDRLQPLNELIILKRLTIDG